MAQNANTNDHPFQIIVIRSSSIGDIVLATAVVGYAKAWSEATGHTVCLHWLTKGEFQAIPRSSGPLVTVHDIDSVMDTTNQTLPKKIDVIVDLQGNLRARKLSRILARRYHARVLRSKKRYAARILTILAARLFGRSKTSLMLQRWINTQLPVQQQYKMNLEAMAAALGSVHALDVSAIRPKLSAPLMDDRLDQQSKWLAVAPGAAHPSKKAPAQVFERILGALAGELSDEPLPGIVLLGSQSEVSDCQELARRLTANGWDSPILNLGGSTSLEETIGVLASCRAILCNDSSLGHITESLGKPAVVLFGPTSETFGFGPHLSASKSMSVELGCRPCSKHGKVDCRFGDHRCFNEIDTGVTGKSLVKFFKSHRADNKEVLSDSP